MQEVNVRVAVRVRPLLKREELNKEQMCIKLYTSSNQVVIGKDRSFTFDYVLSSKTQQTEVYDQCVSNLVKSCFEGYNATVFAYGQTGSGKTYTIGDGMEMRTDEEQGIITRAVDHMFNIIESKPEVTCIVKVSYVEIYKEDVKDLLEAGSAAKDVIIREDENGHTWLVGCREIICQSQEEVLYLLASGSDVRHTGSTQMNEHSSRSHSIFTVVLEQTWGDQDPPSAHPTSELAEDEVDPEVTHFMSAKFHFVDLAGSERAHKTGNYGDRFKESVHINSGLLALGNVISALGDPKKKVTHIPYRDSKITRLLKDSLGGNAQTVMICCVSPAASNFDESLNALKYANRARNIRNTPIVNRDSQSVRYEEMQNEIKALREELQRQRTTMVSGMSDVPDTARLKELQHDLDRSLSEREQFQRIALAACRQLEDLANRDLLSASVQGRLEDWTSVLLKLKEGPLDRVTAEKIAETTLTSLRQELVRCKQHLRSDEDIFAEKNRIIADLQDKIGGLEDERAGLAEELGEVASKTAHQEAQLVQQQVTIQQLQQTCIPEEETGDSLDLGDSVTSGSGRRATSVPAHVLRNRGMSAVRPPPRTIKTAPSVVSLERVMQGFRARSHLMASAIEEDDEVLHQHFSSDEDDDAQSGLENSGHHTFRISGSASSSSFRRQGTFKVKDGKTVLERLRSKTTLMEGMEGRQTGKHGASTRAAESSGEPSQAVRASGEQARAVRASHLRLSEAQNRLRDLNINIRLKEQLIKELVRSDKDAKDMTRHYARQVEVLQQEKTSARAELADAQGSLAGLEGQVQTAATEKHKLEKHYSQKIEAAKTRISTLQRQQKESEKLAAIAGQSERRMSDLEDAVTKMKGQQDALQKKLKEEQDNKARIEREMAREQQRVRELEARAESQQKVLRRKTEEAASAQRRLRSARPRSAAATPTSAAAAGLGLLPTLYSFISHSIAAVPTVYPY